MERITRRAIDTIMASAAQPAVTIYVPMHTNASPPHISENQIRFKNLLSKAAAELSKTDKKSAANQKLAQRLQAMVDEHMDNLAFWEHQTPGLLICANQDFIKLFQLPVDTQEYVSVDEHFHLAPVLAIVEDNREYYVLTLAQHTPKLFKGDAYGLSATNIALPTDIESGLGIDENNQKSENQGSARGLSTDTGWFNGRGGARNPQEADRMKFLRMIDDALVARADRSLPIIIAGIDSEVAEFRSVSHYPKILKKHIPGNHTNSELHDIFPRAIEIIRTEVVEPVHTAAVEEYSRLKGANPERTANEQQNLLDAAVQGRIDKLLVSVYQKTTDTVRDTLSAVTQLTFPASKQTARQLNRTAFHVWTTSGHIISLQPAQIPDNKPMVARLRY